MIFSYEGSTHDQAIDARFGPDCHVEPGSARIQVTLLAFANRSGSNFLAELLRATGAFAGFKESLNDYSVNHLAPLFGADTFAQYLTRLRAEEVQDKPFWGLKVGWQQLALLLRTQAIPNLLDASIVMIERQDVIAQAVSYFIAERTGAWTADHGSKADLALDYEAGAIYDAMIGALDAYDMFRRLFRLFELPYSHIYYEDLIADPACAIATLTRSLTGRAMTPDGEPSIRRQNSARSQAFAQRFRTELTGLVARVNPMESSNGAREG
jgi:trehalose 2-sulfotransferase